MEILMNYIQNLQIYCVWCYLGIYVYRYMCVCVCVPLYCNTLCTYIYLSIIVIIIMYNNNNKYAYRPISIALQFSGPPRNISIQFSAPFCQANGGSTSTTRVHGFHAYLTIYKYI